MVRSLTTANVIEWEWSRVVYRAKIPSMEVLTTVKRFWTCDEAAVAVFTCEIVALDHIRHWNIVQLLGWAANHRTRLLFYDYLPNRILGDLLHGGGGPVVEWEVRLDIAIGVTEGLTYLHYDCIPPILHHDIKADNILLGERYEAYLMDFGLANVVDDSTAVGRGNFILKRNRAFG
ncbi:leucine-rich repeat receptor-like serine/threonine-protein kinase RGI4 [Elaeis guineensis]|uniref:non-specific serine/threonine protein kinase n=1 Tax=Elaeis guineensis var. tenera TaxID=51953 RepID=A0A6J0PNC1_ELAGV|nr:LRR receptor-like serine/threonine-protein kinase [Elaeis guineensis]